MSDNSHRLSLPVRTLIRFLLTIGLVWALATFLEDYVFISGGFIAYVIIGALLTLMNLLVRPVLNAVTLPLRLLATILALIIVNGLFLGITYWIAMRMDPSLVTFEILGASAAGSSSC